MMVGRTWKAKKKPRLPSEPVGMARLPKTNFAPSVVKPRYLDEPPADPLERDLEPAKRSEVCSQGFAFEDEHRKDELKSESGEDEPPVDLPPVIGEEPRNADEKHDAENAAAYGDE